MDELISKQAAIKAFDGEKYDNPFCGEYEVGYNDGIDFAVSTLSDLPSAQPEIIRCKECVYAHLTYDGQCKYCDQMKDEDDDYIEMYLDGDFFCGFAERRQNALN